MTTEVVSYLAPPLRDQAIVIGTVTKGPIDLGRHVVNTVGLVPCKRVAEDAVILPIAARGTWLYPMFSCHCRTRSGNTSRRDAIANVGPSLLDHVIDSLDHAIDIVTSPVTE